MDENRARVLDDLLAEQRSANETYRVAASRTPAPGKLDAASLRRARLFRRDGSRRPWASPTAWDEHLATAAGSLLVRHFPAPEAAAVALHFHGGGWTLGSIYEQDRYLVRLAEASKMQVVSIDYPLSPESRLATIVDAAEAAVVALVQRSAAPVTVVGESAGAHVALNCVMRLRSRPELLNRICGMSLSYGIYDLSMTPSQREWGSEFLGLSTDWLEWFYAQTLPGLTAEQRGHPAYSPLRANLEGLPPAIFSIGTLDPLLDDTLLMFDHWQVAGNPGELHVYPEAPHGFNHMDTALADLCNERIFGFLAAARDR